MPDPATAPPAGILVRQAEAADALELRAVRLEALRTDPVAFTADYDRDSQTDWAERIRQQEGRGAIFLAYEGRRTAGMLGIFRGATPKTRHSAVIWGVYVRRPDRGRGIGRALMEEAFSWARKHGVNILKLGVVTDNMDAVRFYENLGFTRYGTEPKGTFVDGVYYDEFLMAKAL